MEPRFFDAHCHLDLMLSPMLQPVSRRHWVWGSLTAASIHATFRPLTSAPVANQASSPALGSTPGGSPTAGAEPPRSTYFASSLAESALSARSDSIFHHALRAPRESRRRHLSGFAKLYRSTTRWARPVHSRRSRSGGNLGHFGVERPSKERSQLPHHHLPLV